MSVMSIHWVDGYRFMLQDEAVSVYARVLTDGHGVDHAVSMVIQFKGGTVASLSESFDSYAKPSLCCLDGESGGLVLGYDKLTIVRPNQPAREVPNPMDKSAATYWVLDDLLRAIESKTAPETNAADNLKTMRMLEAAYQSMAEDRVVHLEAAR